MGETEIIFLHPFSGILSFFIGCIFISLFFKKLKEYSYKHFVSLQEFQKVYKQGLPYKILLWSFFLTFLAIVSLIIADPRIQYKTIEKEKKWIDMVLVFDVSLSMLAEDIPPNRLEMAKKVLIQFIDKIETDRIGLVIFSGKPFLWFPLTDDYQFIKRYIENINILSINQNIPELQWTAIGDALVYGASLFEKESNQETEKVIILFTDGDANKGIDPQTALRYIKSKKIKVYTVGIGGDEDTYIIWKQSKIYISWINEENLKSIAQSTWGKYHRARDVKTFQEIFSSLQLLNKTETKQKEHMHYTPYYLPFLSLLVIVTTIGMILFLFYFPNISIPWHGTKS